MLVLRGYQFIMSVDFAEFDTQYAVMLFKASLPNRYSGRAEGL